MNELILIISLIVEFGLIILAYRLFGKIGLYAMTVICSITANIEVMILIEAFGMEQTLGNVLFAASFLITDILGELEGKKTASLAVNIGIFSSIVFVFISQSWLIYTPVSYDEVIQGIHTIFSSTPRIMITSLVVYGITQMLDVIMYHKLWEFTTKHFGDSRKYMWIRNNVATLICQLLNTVLFTIGAFLGKYPSKVLISICVSSYIIFIFTSILDTPFLYLARWMKEKGKIPEGV